MKFKALDLTLASMFVGLMAIGANITSFVPFMVVGGVPITLQTFFAILAGIILGSRLGAISMTVYALVGLVGVPVFAKFGAGLSTFISPTFGFILSFIFTAYVAGKMVEKNRTLFAFIFASLTGLVINYVFGTNWMYFAYKFWAAAPEGFTYKMAWLWMVVPLPKDIILAVFAGMMGYRLEKTVLQKGSFKHLRKAA
ncbi:biotin transporter BioY [Mesobacillus selenatarsenatis]|uniref:Biotin transporter n=1 Tax=Mesobacillus selenatarsenatis (strain DSM 18680 / JCM 14380 / FERM P-15431 / SF-1) TaxID=1321606 RepID=A0A0A8XA78_MESS1|nr:biotin transporter BioY [Mesobacillus selenatarsenatis]GAM15076.1 substrate-specific component BioY of biotin ECF transporter [Mesobacillus selenatarsenatis SF-1]